MANRDSLRALAAASQTSSAIRTGRETGTSSTNASNSLVVDAPAGLFGGVRAGRGGPATARRQGSAPARAGRSHAAATAGDLWAAPQPRCSCRSYRPGSAHTP
ncbi:hypothetical protein P3T39_003127 [Kitasatospora sp. GP82]|nr:hypothetical protein [Kitasatospora sp. GP82]